MILIDALFINKGGGAVLLQYLIETIMNHAEKDQFFFLLDPRFERPEILPGNYAVVPNKLGDRIKFYKQNKESYSKVFCFANTPPPVKMQVPVYTYFHNQKITEAPGKKFQRRYFRDFLKYLLVKRYSDNTNYYIVQTQHMTEALLDAELTDAEHCLTIPFYDDRKYKIPAPAFEDRVKDEFVFISNPSPQKNHSTLLDAWDLLLKRGLKPKLHVTIDDTAPELIVRIDDLNSRGARIENHVYVDPKELYMNCPYLIFPSVTESFGLPLIEAADCGMKILASDLPYVYDVVKPSIVFSPYNKVSVADAVEKALTQDLPMPVLVVKNEIMKLIDLLVS